MLIKDDDDDDGGGGGSGEKDGGGCSGNFETVDNDADTVANDGCFDDIV